jgi:hypothetical protein
MNNEQAKARLEEIEPFLQPHQVNYIRQQIKTLIGAFYFAGDYRVLAASRESIIHNLQAQFTGLTPEQKTLLNEAGQVRDHDELKRYLTKLAPFVIPFPEITAAEIRKLFPKVKKLVLPDLGALDRTRIDYLGWRDMATNTIYFVRRMNEKWVGAECRYVLGQSNRSYVCTWCQRSRPGDQVALVTKQLKVKNLQDGYKTVGNHLCLDSQACNDSLTSTTAMDTFLLTLK